MTQDYHNLWDVVLALRGRLAVAERRIDQLENFIRERFDEPSSRRRRPIGFVTSEQDQPNEGAAQ